MPSANHHEKRELKGMVKCGKNCPCCPYVRNQKEVKIDTNRTWKINRKYNCETYNVIYLITQSLPHITKLLAHLGNVCQC